jgi:hypothetical protein
LALKDHKKCQKGSISKGFFATLPIIQLFVDTIMKRTTTIVLFASIFAVGTLGLSGNSATSLMLSAVPQTQESVGMLGHVEYKVMDSSGVVIQYMQGDNEVVNDGEDCS